MSKLKISEELDMDLFNSWGIEDDEDCTEYPDESEDEMYD
jgi:hypothetical protein